jgi:hypothetical protein
MKTPKRFTCTICGEHSTADTGWFLVVQDSWLDRLKILHWNSGLAAQDGVHALCGAMHVRELVAHWMATGSLEYPFASLSSSEQRLRIIEFGAKKRGAAATELQNAALIGELAVHRASLERALRENPQSLSAILEALLGALRDDLTKTRPLARPKEELAVV